MEDSDVHEPQHAEAARSEPEPPAEGHAGDSESGTDRGAEEPDASGPAPPSTLVLTISVAFVVVFLAWTMRQTWFAAFPSY